MSKEKRGNKLRTLVLIVSIVVVAFIAGSYYLFNGSKGTYSATSTIFDNCLFVGDSRYALLTSEIQTLGNNVMVRAVSGSTVSNWKNVVVGEERLAGAGIRMFMKIVILIL